MLYFPYGDGRKALKAYNYKAHTNSCLPSDKRDEQFAGDVFKKEVLDMFHEMRRKKQLLSEEACQDILRRGTSGVLALGDRGDYPYAVPISYVYDGSKIYFHGAKVGHKMEAIEKNSRVSFCVIDQDRIVPEKYTTYFRSVIVFGEIRILEEEPEKRRAIEKLAVKYAPQDSPEGRQEAIDRDYGPLCMLELAIEHMTGKEAIELVRERQK